MNHNEVVLMVERYDGKLQSTKISTPFHKGKFYQYRAFFNNWDGGEEMIRVHRIKSWAWEDDKSSGGSYFYFNKG